MRKLFQCADRSIRLILFMICFVISVNSIASDHQQKKFERVLICYGVAANDIEKRIAELLRDRIIEKSTLTITVEQCRNSGGCGTIASQVWLMKE